jgi:hypothetical protein
MGATWSDRNNPCEIDDLADWGYPQQHHQVFIYRERENQE